MDLFNLDISKSDSLVETVSSSLKYGLSRISLMVGRLWGVTLRIDLIRLISSVAELMMDYWIFHWRKFLFSFGSRLPRVSFLGKEPFLRSSRTIKSLEPKYQFYSHRVCFEPFLETYIHKFHIKFSFPLGWQQTQNHTAWLYFCWWGECSQATITNYVLWCLDAWFNFHEGRKQPHTHLGNNFLCLTCWGLRFLIFRIKCLHWRTLGPCKWFTFPFQCSALAIEWC